MQGQVCRGLAIAELGPLQPHIIPTQEYDAVELSREGIWFYGKCILLRFANATVAVACFSSQLYFIMWPQQCNEAARKKRKLEAESGTVACGTHHNNGNPVTIFNTSAWPLSSNADLMGAWNETHVLSNFDQTSCWDAQAANPHFQHQQYQPSSEVYQNTSDMFNIQSHVANMVYHPHLVPMPTPSAQYNFQLLGGSAWTAPEPAYTTNVAESFDNTTSIINEALSEALQDTMELDTTTVAGVKSKKSGHMNIDDDEIVCFGVVSPQEHVSGYQIALLMDEQWSLQ